MVGGRPWDERLGWDGMGWKDSNVQAHERKCEQRFIHPANHRAGLVAPVLRVTSVRQRAAHVPC